MSRKRFACGPSGPVAYIVAGILGTAVLIGGPGLPSASELPGQSIPFASVPGFAKDDHAAALATFRMSCRAIVAQAEPIRSAQKTPPALKTICATALAMGDDVSASAARAFFEEHFTARRLDGGFLTGYYEPVVEGSLVRNAEFQAPILARPADLVSAAPGHPLPDLDPALTAGRRLGDGRLVAFPDRAAIEAGALGASAPPLVYVRDPVEAFFIQVQGSARVHLRDGSVRRLVYAGRNGYPYTSIGRVLVAQLNVPPASMGMVQLKDWIRANGQSPGQPGAALMQRNRSYIFFTFDETLAPQAGPVGGAGISLTPLRSLAIDRQVWPYGLPIFIDAVLPWQSEDSTPFRRLMIAQDTGSAIVGPARGDIFFGSGAEAALRAGPLRHPGTLFVLWPRTAGLGDPGLGDPGGDLQPGKRKLGERK